MSSVLPDVNHLLNMEKNRESLKSSTINQRICIKYGVLEKKSCWDSYKKFCEKMGNKDMSYPDFEFWFMRFSSGEMDINYDISLEPKKSTFADLPLTLISMIAEDYLQPTDRILFRQVSPGIQEVVDQLKPNFKKIDIEMSDSIFSLKLGTDRITYRKEGEGHKMEKYDPKTYEFIYFDKYVDKTYMDGISDAFWSIFSSKQAKFDELEVDLRHAIENDWNELMKRSSLNKHSGINVKSLEYSGRVVENCLLSLLDRIAPGTLETIILGYLAAETYERVAATEQWRQAKRVRNWRIHEALRPDQLQYFIHFDEFHVAFDDLGVDILVALKNELQKSKNFKNCFIRIESAPFNAANLAVAIGRIVRDDGTIWDPIPDSTDFLVFEFIHEITIKISRITKEQAARFQKYDFEVSLREFRSEGFPFETEFEIGSR